MSGLLKITDKVNRFDQPVGAPLEFLDKFHTAKTDDVNPRDRAGLATTKTYEDGLMEGRAESVGEIENQRADILTAVLALQQTVQSISAQIEASHGRVVTQVLQAVLPALARDAVMVEVSDFISKISAPALQGDVSLEVPEHLHDLIETALAQLLTKISDGGHTPEISVKINGVKPDSKDRNHICAKWQGGGGTVDIEGAVDSCLALLKHAENNYIGIENGKS